MTIQPDKISADIYFFFLLGFFCEVKKRKLDNRKNYQIYGIQN